MTYLQRVIVWIKMYRGGLLTILGLYNTLINLFSASQLPPESISALELLRNKLRCILDKARTTSDKMFGSDVGRVESYAVDNLNISNFLEFYSETKNDFVAVSLSFQNEVEKGISNLNPKYFQEINLGLEQIKSLRQDIILLLDSDPLQN